MRQSIQSVHLTCIAALTLIVTACSGGADPATDEPVSLAPGLYEISVSQKLKQFSDEGKAPKPICVSEREIDSFPYKLAEDYIVSQRGCRTERFPREGNKISGEVACAADRNAAAGTTRFVYSGVVRRDRVLLEGNMVLDVKLQKGAGGPEVSDAALEKAFRSVEDIKTVIDSRRVSDCP